MTRTPSQTVGPFFTIGLARRTENVLDPDGVELVGRVLDGAGAPVPDALVEVWDGVRFGRSPTDADGAYSFLIARPEPRPGQAPHLELLVFARGLLRHQLTRVYFPGEEANGSDPVLAALPEADRETLVAEREGERLRFDLRMQGERATVFFEPL